MSGSLVQHAEDQSDTVWLLLSDQSRRRFGARTFEALILNGRTRIPAVWHSIGRDSLRVEWESLASAQSVLFRETPDGIAGHATTKGEAVARSACDYEAPLQRSFGVSCQRAWELVNCD